MHYFYNNLITLLHRAEYLSSPVIRKWINVLRSNRTLSNEITASVTRYWMVKNFKANAENG